ncbi:DNA primase [Marinovum sp. 2_MG-2023]|uniref:DNA primase n=1 Tax=Roseobacteraceae TaxID=2854170 RepID=UPI001FD606F3|nr:MULTISPECIES: DNA primase [Roseobacteraceae]MCJ7874678.1 DNA primase [Phaeobacter sp. J2-8]MDO6728851.1 DNA primase [Marinovum sp. 2_MG-2023]MDO6777733.1 DNA primase [Marinovum sp. 1_MG-2023]
MRFLLVTCFALMPAATLAANPDCAVFGEIVDKIVAERQDGAVINASMETVAGEYTGRKKRFVPTIPALAEWVYSLPEADLSAGPGDVFAEQCNAQ